LIASIMAFCTSGRRGLAARWSKFIILTGKPP
jgi:hypothetical protein